ncbi:MAG: hypothetical protein IPO15_24180 [Anaerolineae bacterium]|uniref:hypothetical protein n=1 Tax=Candidatus Amarolinea dominans TaxID=3140696 RepID=UPI0031365044|nr:hypothetical protein [Anaerolineae bacterium]
MVSLPPLELLRGDASGRAAPRAESPGSDLTVASVRPGRQATACAVAWGITRTVTP